MPIINERDQRYVSEQFQAFTPDKTPDFGEVYGAAVGQVFDEGLSISALLNREGEATRRMLIDEKVRKGEIDREDPRFITRERGSLNYSAIAHHLKDPSIKTDDQIREERNAMLKQRREYAQDVMARGSTTAQVLGGLTGFVLDPISIATVGIAAPLTAAKSLTVLGRAARTARNAAIIEGSIELGLQAFVYDHKQEIDSPYDASDVLANVAMAATGAAVLGGVAGGLSGWLDKVLKHSDTLLPEDEVLAAQKYLIRMKENLEFAKKAEALPEVDIQAIQARVMADAREEILSIQDSVLREADEELMPIAGEVMSRGDLKTLRAEKNHLEYELSKIQKPGADEFKEAAAKVKAENPRMKARAQKEEARKIVDSSHAQEVDVYKSRLAIIERQIQRHETAAEARADLARIDQGIIPTRYQKIAHARIAEALVKRDVEFLRTMQQKREELARPDPIRTETPEDMPDAPKAAAPKKAGEAGQTLTRERDLLQRAGLEKEFDADMAALKALKNPIIEIDGEQINVNDMIKTLDDEIEGLESVLTCTIGVAA